MIEVFPEKDYNKLTVVAARLGASVDVGEGGFIMREDDKIIGVALYKISGLAAHISAVTAPDKYAQYYDLLFRSTINHLMRIAEIITVNDINDYYIPLGFTADGSIMTASARQIIFPHNCK